MWTLAFLLSCLNFLWQTLQIYSPSKKPTRLFKYSSSSAKVPVSNEVLFTLNINPGSIIKVPIKSILYWFILFIINFPGQHDKSKHLHACLWKYIPHTPAMLCLFLTCFLKESLVFETNPHMPQATPILSMCFASMWDFKFTSWVKCFWQLAHEYPLGIFITISLISSSTSKSEIFSFRHLFKNLFIYFLWNHTVHSCYIH